MKKIEFKVDPVYFENIEKAITSLNDFFKSNFKQKNFPIDDDDDDMELEPCLSSIIRWINYVDPSWIDNTSKMEETLDNIHDRAGKMGKYDDSFADGSDRDTDEDANINDLNAYIGFQVLQYITKNQKEFGSLLEGIHTLELFFNPSKYKDALNTFTQPIELSDVADSLGDDVYTVFDIKTYVNGIFHSSEIEIPSGMNQQKEIQRIENRIDIPDYEIITTDEDDETYQEQAEINFFSMVNPNHIRYHQNRFQPSQQFVKVIKQLITGLRKCNTPEDVRNYLNDKNNHVNPDDYTSMVLPSILARVFADKKMFENRLFDEKNLKKYTDSYDSIMKQNDGAKRFKDYDLLSTFKSDKDGTIQFLEDFLSLRLVSDQNAAITNHTLLVIFNIFDSRIYLDILYNILPQSEKKGEYETEDGFVKAVRARINENSKKATPYSNDKPIDQAADKTVKTSQEITEYVSLLFKSMGDISLEELPYYENLITEAVHMEINTIGDKAYNVGVSESDIEHYIGEAALAPYKKKNFAISGKVPTYMQDRIDGYGDDKPQTSVEDVDLPEGVPTNDIGDLIDSIDERVDTVEDNEEKDPDLSYGFGNDADVTPTDSNDKKQDGHVVYNITYNYHNSNNTTTTTDSHNTTTTTRTTRDSHDKHDSHNIHARYDNDFSVNKTSGGEAKNTYNPQKKTKAKVRSNNYNNDTSSLNTKDDTRDTPESDTNFSTGKSVQEVFAMLQSKEPLFNEGASEIAGSMIGSFGADMGLLPDTNPEPKVPLNVRLQDVDRKMLGKQEEMRKNLQAVDHTVRAAKMPFDRAKAWITDMVDGLIKRDEDKVKYELLEDKNYRTAVKKAFRIACDLGLYSAAFMISPFIGCLAIGNGAIRYGDRTRMKKEIQNEFVTEIQILDKKISKARADHKDKEMYELMRIRQKMVEKAANITKDPIAKVKQVNNIQTNGYAWDYD